jgi:DNA polymerase (family 10)
MSISNAAIADIFNLLSKLMDIHQENSFKSKSYSSAAFAIDKLSESLCTLDKNQIPLLNGIGVSTAGKIIEILNTGKLVLLEDLISKTPAGVLEMLQIKGLGPKKISTIWKEMGIESVGELLYACQENRLTLFKGFGEKTQKNVADAIEFIMRHQGHFLFASVENYVHQIQAVLISNFPESYTMVTGEFARQIPTLEKIEWLTSIQKDTLVEWLKSQGFDITETAADSLLANNTEGIPLKFNIVSASEFMPTLFRQNCSEEFLEAFSRQYPNAISNISKEEDAFLNAGISVLPVFLRESAKQLRLSDEFITNIVTPGDIRGIIHSHSNWSDGSNTLEEMVRACIAKGYEYLVISDHSKTAFYANGLSEEKVKAQHQQIDELNHKYAPFKIFKSIESDILNDGALDYPDYILQTFDLVIASVHSNLKMSEEKAMQRLIKAIENPFTTILGHPTGRLLLSRNGYPLDHEKIIDTCVANNVVIEINAHPRRLDLDWKWIGRAQEKGAILSINPDAHHVDGFDDVRYGVLAAQKGGLQKQNNLSSWSLEKLEKHLQR